MTQGQRTTILTLITEVILLIWYAHRFFTGHAQGRFDGAEGLMTLGHTTLWAIGFMVVFIIIAHILAYIIAAIANRGELPEDVDLTDERDKMIEARGEKIAHILGGLGLVTALVLLSQGSAVALVIALIFMTHIAGDAVGNVVKIATYGRG